MSKDRKKTSKGTKKKSTTANCPTKMSRPKPEDKIATSKKLIGKMQSCRRKSNLKPSRLSNRTNNNGTRFCANGKPMPPLSELEKMFEDSDDEEEPKIITEKEKSSSEKLYSPSKIKEIADKMMDMISNIPDPTSIDSYSPSVVPPKKRKKSEVSYSVKCEEQMQVPAEVNTYDIDTNEECPNNRMKKNENVNISKSNLNSKRNEIASSVKCCEYSDHSDGSTDSNKTVNYDLNKTPDGCSRLQSFNPLPSTSKDRATINKNDRLFSKSLNDTGTNENQSTIDTINETNTDSSSGLKIQISNEQNLADNTINNTRIDDDIEILQTPCETIVIDDDIEINDTIECIETAEPDIKKDNLKSMQDSKAIVIDDDPISDEVTEVIDIDDIIAENKAIIEKYSTDTNKDINTVTNVDSSTISNLNNNEETRIEPTPSNLTNDASETVNTNVVNIDDESTSTQNFAEYLQVLITDFFTLKSSNKSRPQVPFPRGTHESVLQKFSNWVEIFRDDDTANSHDNSRNNSQDDNVIQIHDLITRAIRGSQSHREDHYYHRSRYPHERICNKNHEHHNSRKHNHILKKIESWRVHGHAEPSDQQPAPAASTSTSPTKNFGDCPICMDNLANRSVASTICGHVFCLRCIQAAFRTSGKKCPTCRKTLKKGGYHKIFL